MYNQAAQLAVGAPTLIQNASGINMGNLIDEHKLSKSYVEQYSRDFPQLQTLVDGVPLNPDNDAPYVGDTTLAGLVRSIPRDSLQQMPVFSAVVNGTEISVPAYICTFLLKKYAFNEDTFGKGLLSTLQIGTEQALTLGYAAFMVATGSLYNDFGTTLRLLHYMDTSPEPGIQDHNETGYDYVVSHPTRSRVQKIRNQAAKNKNTSWNLEALDLVLAATPRATNYSQWQSTARQNNAGEAASPSYEFVTRYPVASPNEQIITFCPEVNEVPLRVMDSRSKFGYPRVQYLVIDPAPLVPFGVSRVRLASPNQNLMNIYYGNIASMLLLNSKPPIMKRGRFTTPVALKQGVTWETMDQNADAKLINLDNGALEYFPQMAAQFAGQIQNIMGGKTISTNAGTKSGFGHTAPGEKRAQQFEDSSSNQITKILENFIRQYALVALDVLFSEQEGEDDIIVDDETKNNINHLIQQANTAIQTANATALQAAQAAGMPVPEPQPLQNLIGDDNTFHMVWGTFYDAIKEWSVKITVSLSKDELEDKKRADLQDMLVVLAQNKDSLPPKVAAPLEAKNINNTPVEEEPAPADGKDVHDPREDVNFKDVVAAGALPAAAAMLEQAGLPSDGVHEVLPKVAAPAKTPAKPAAK
jgi:hypothetical protein